MRIKLLAVSLLALVSQAVRADIAYVTALTSNCTSQTICGNGINPDTNPNTGQPVYSDNFSAGFTSAISTVPGKPPTPGARYFSIAFSNSTPDFGITIRPSLTVTGGVYRLYHVYSSSAGNVSTNIVLGVTNLANCALSFTSTDKFQRSFGAPVGGANVWQFLGYVTNAVDSADPEINFYFLDGIVNAGPSQRLVVDTFRFILDDPCLDIATVSVTGPLATNLPNVVVSGVTNASAVTVYQDSGAGMIAIGTLNTGVTDGNNAVPVTGLVKGAQVAATQTVGGQEGCVPLAGILVGGGANPRLRVVLSVRETSSTGPVGASGLTTGVGANIHFLGASTRIGSAPGDGPVLLPSTSWQTLTFDRGTILLGNPSNLTATVTSDGGYNAGDTVALRVFAFRAVPETGKTIYSRVPAQSSVVTSNDAFAINWMWDAVPDAEGYRLLRDYNSDNYTNNSTDVFTTTFLDQNNLWGALATVLPSDTHTNAAVKWNAQTGSSTNGSLNDLRGQWGTLDAIALAIDDLSDTGPYDLYIDNLQNGSTVFQTFESVVGNTAEYGFRNPSNSGTTAGNILGAPNSSRVSVRAADTGFKSLHVKFQWNGTNDTKWVRLTTSTTTTQNPLINLDDPTSIRFLLLPPEESPVPAPQPSLAISNNAAGQSVLTWTGTHNLQASSLVTGAYTNVPSVTTAPWTNTFSESEKFFRLSNPLDN